MQILRLVFDSKTCLVAALLSALALWVLFNILDGLILLDPVPSFYSPIPPDAILGLVLSTITAALSGVVVGMNIFLISSRVSASKASLLSGSALGTISSVCAGCSSVGFYLASTLGVAGVATSSLLSTYQLPLRVAAVGVLILAYYVAHRRITSVCAVT